MRRNKNYFRYDLLALADEYQGKAILFTGIYKHRGCSPWLTLSAVRICSRPETKTISGHINLNRSQVERFLKLSEIEHKSKIYFYGKITAYQHYGDIRGGIDLATIDKGCHPIWISKSNDSENNKQALIYPRSDLV